MVATSLPLVAVRSVWGTTIRIEVCDPITQPALDPLWDWFQRVDDLFSTWRDDSEISKLARGEIDLAGTSAEVRVVLDLCEQLKVASAGAFDIGFAGEAFAHEQPGHCAIDPTGVVKGWALDRASELLTAQGAANFAINAGGDIVVRGRPLSHAAWRVGIQHPWQRDKAAAIVGLTNRAIATSGGYERGAHVIDPRTGRGAEGLASVSVVTADLARADGYATAALALGSEGMAWLATLPEVDAMGITDDRRAVKTAGFDELVIA